VDEIRTDLELWLLKPRPTMGEIWSPTLRLEQLVVNPELRRWEAMQALSLVYRDVYFTQVVDRYQAKWRGYVELAGGARESFLAVGWPMVMDPVHRASPPVLIATAGSGTAGTFYASVAWVNAAGQVGAASEVSSMTLVDGYTMIIAGTNPPPNARGLMVYAGTTLNGLMQQNLSALPVTGSLGYIPGQVTAGPLAGFGQKPDFVRPVARTILRG
jgi:hypothetical protein